MDWVIDELNPHVDLWGRPGHRMSQRILQGGSRPISVTPFLSFFSTRSNLRKENYRTNVLHSPTPSSLSFEYSDWSGSRGVPLALCGSPSGDGAHPWPTSHLSCSCSRGSCGSSESLHTGTCPFKSRLHISAFCPELLQGHSRPHGLIPLGVAKAQLRSAGTLMPPEWPPTKGSQRSVSNFSSAWCLGGRFSLLLPAQSSSPCPQQWAL